MLLKGVEKTRERIVKAMARTEASGVSYRVIKPEYSKETIEHIKQQISLGLANSYRKLEDAISKLTTKC